MSPSHDTDPSPAHNGDDADDEARVRSARELLVRVDERSLATHQAVIHFRAEVGRELRFIRDRFVSIERSIDDLDRTTREAVGSVPEMARRSADESGEHVQQELRNLQEKLAQKEREELEVKLAAAQKQIEAERQAAEDERKETRKRWRNLGWKVFEWALIGALAFTASHMVWH
jgi:chromosome segregation ATPase